MGVSPRGISLPMGCGHKGAPGSRPNPGKHIWGLSNFLASCQPGGTQPMSQGTSLVLTWAGIVSAPRKPYETPGGLNLPGHRLMWKVGVLSYTDARTPKDPQGQLKSGVVSGVFCFGLFYGGGGGWGMFRSISICPVSCLLLLSSHLPVSLSHSTLAAKRERRALASPPASSPTLVHLSHS